MSIVLFSRSLSLLLLSIVIPTCETGPEEVGTIETPSCCTGPVQETFRPVVVEVERPDEGLDLTLRSTVGVLPDGRFPSLVPNSGGRVTQIPAQQQPHIERNHECVEVCVTECPCLVQGRVGTAVTEDPSSDALSPPEPGPCRWWCWCRPWGQKYQQQ